MIDLTMHEEQLKHAIDRAKERNILIPTFAQMQNPQLVPEKVSFKDRVLSKLRKSDV